MKKIDELSIFILAYNEEDNIGRSIDNAFDAAEKFTEKFEIIIVLYEGSKDNTRAIVENLMKERKNLRIVIQPLKYKGYGVALKYGIRNSRYRHIFYTDADNQFDLNEIGRLLPYIDKYAIISGYRKKRNDPFMRLVAAKVYKIIINMLFLVNFRDVDSAFKIYNRRIFDYFKIICKTGMADAEILVKAKKKGFKIKEVPVSHYSRAAGKGQFDSAIFNVIKPSIFWGLLREMSKLRLRLVFGRFK